MAQIRVAQLGFGYWGPNLLRNLVASPRFDVVGLYDLSEDRLKQANSQYPAIKCSTDVSSAISRSDVDALVIATPAKTHFSLCAEALSNGKHVLVEKPMATSVSQIDELTTIAEEQGVVLMSGHTFIFNEAVKYLKMLIDSGDLGEVRYLYSQRLNLGRIRSDIDALWNFCPHDVSMMQYLLSDPVVERVSAFGSAHIQKDIMDVAFVNIGYPNNVIANIHVSWLDPVRTRRLTVVGSQKMVVYDDIGEHKIAIYDKGIDVKAEDMAQMDYDFSKGPLSFTYRDGNVLMPKINFSEPLKQEISHFADCIEKDLDCCTGPGHTRTVVEILERATADLYSSQR